MATFSLSNRLRFSGQRVVPWGGSDRPVLVSDVVAGSSPPTPALGTLQASRGNGASSGLMPGLSQIRTPSPVILRVSIPGWAPLCNQGFPCRWDEGGCPVAQGAPPRGLVLTLCAPWDSEPRGLSFFHRHAGLGFKGTWRVGISPPHIGAQLHYRRGCRQ